MSDIIYSKFKKEKHYSLRPAKPVPTELDKYLLEISNGNLNLREAQEIYGFSKSTLQRFSARGSQTPLSAGAPKKLTDIEFETIAEKCRANFIGTARVAANSSQHLAPFFEACRVYHDFFPKLRSKVGVSIIQHAGLCSTRSL